MGGNGSPGGREGFVELIQVNHNSTIPLASLLPQPQIWFCLHPSITVLQSMKLGIDVNRHKEIIVKSISALLLLLLKHFKLNHIYQVGLEEGMAIARLPLKVLLNPLLDFQADFPSGVVITFP